MAKKVLAKDQFVKLIVGAGQASPSPPVGPALGSKGVKSMDFCKVITFFFLLVSQVDVKLKQFMDRSSMLVQQTSNPALRFQPSSPSALIDLLPLNCEHQPPHGYYCRHPGYNRARVDFVELKIPGLR